MGIFSLQGAFWLTRMAGVWYSNNIKSIAFAINL